MSCCHVACTLFPLCSLCAFIPDKLTYKLLSVQDKQPGMEFDMVRASLEPCNTFVQELIAYNYSVYGTLSLHSLLKL